MPNIKHQLLDNNWTDFSDEHYEQTDLGLWLHLRAVLKDHLQDQLWDNIRDHIWLQLQDGHDHD